MYLKCIFLLLFNNYLPSKLSLVSNVKKINLNEDEVHNLKPRIINDMKEDKGYYLRNTQVEFECRAYGYPLPKMYWDYTDNYYNPVENPVGNKIFTNSGTEYNKTHIRSIVKMTIGSSANLSCKACNDFGCDSAVIQTIYTMDVPNGFYMIKPIYDVKVGDGLKLFCYASIYNYTDIIQWYNGSKYIIDDTGRVTISRTVVKGSSFVSELTIHEINKWDANFYSCAARSKDGVYKYNNYELVLSDKVIYSYPWTDTFYELLLSLFCVFLIIQFSILSVHFLLKIWSNEI
ncbi:uncharacterized protein LOC103570310 isoform X2 [Microplitis demolitor]|uniref:uncharacterized protein LOC103570310 isoform X2 n=1 Tax=Microplitis demolitor TaxID=69319 RepID=UPI00235B5E6A|nr:uncharacterized protein LOC103570310 isoform X2 [Microplitis demolitor]